MTLTFPYGFMLMAAMNPWTPGPYSFRPVLVLGGFPCRTSHR